MNSGIVKRFDHTNLQFASYVDLAVSTKTSADFTCLATIGMSPERDVIITNILRGRWEWPDARRVIAQAVINQEIKLLGIETTAFQLAAFQDLMRMSEMGRTYIRDVKPDKDKLSRAMPLLALAEAGKLYIVKAHWNKDLIDEFLAFPETDHDDQVDAVSGAVQMLSQAPAFYY